MAALSTHRLTTGPRSRRGPRCRPRADTRVRPYTILASLALVAVVAISVVTHAAATRVISIIPATTEMLFAMGAGDRLIAVGSYDTFPPEVEKLPRVGALLDPNVERILSMRPDLVILYGTQTDLKTQLDRARVPYYSYTHRGLADITETVRTLGDRIGAAEKANALATRI